MGDEWTEFRRIVTRSAVRWTIGLGLFTLLVAAGRGRFEAERFPLQLFGYFMVGVVVGVLSWARREAVAPLSEDAKRQKRRGR